MGTVKVKNITIGEGIPKVCIPIVGNSKEEVIETANTIQNQKADLAEWRVDWFEEAYYSGEAYDWALIEEILEQLHKILVDIPLIFTFRTINEGGKQNLEPEIYENLLLQAINSQYVDIIDIEVFISESAVKRLIACAHEKGVIVIGSNHDFQKTPKKEEILSRLRYMQQLSVDIPKIAVMPHSMADVLVLLEATVLMNQQYADRPVITMSMSKLGVISRISGQIFGSAVTFAAIGTDSAPGQIPAGDMYTILRLLDKNR